jgi:hypothetical protein
MKIGNLLVIIISIGFMWSCGNNIEKEIVKTVIVTPSGAVLPDSLEWFLSDMDRLNNYKITRNGFANYNGHINGAPDYVIASFGRERCARNLPDTTQLPYNCITFTSYRNNQVVDFVHYSITKWNYGRTYDYEYMPNNSEGIIWNYRFFSNSFVYEIIPGDGSKNYRKSVKIEYPF